MEVKNVRKLKLVTALLLLLSIFSPGLAIAQTVPDGKTELSVDRKGVMRDSTGKVVDWRLFPFTTYADDCNNRLVKGTATKRPGKMCIESKLIVENNLDDKNSAQSQTLREYLAAEPKVYRSRRTGRVNAGRAPRPGPSGDTVIYNRPTSAQLETMESAILSRLATDETFRNNLATALAQNEDFVKAIAAKIPVGGVVLPTPTPTPAGAGVVDPNAVGWLAWSWNNIVSATYWILSWWLTILIIALVVVLLYVLFGKPNRARTWRDDYNKWKERRAKVKTETKIQSSVVPNQTYRETTSSTARSHGNLVDETATVGPPDIPRGEWKEEDEFTRVEPRVKQDNAITHSELVKETVVDVKPVEQT